MPWPRGLWVIGTVGVTPMSKLLSLTVLVFLLTACGPRYATEAQSADERCRQHEGVRSLETAYGQSDTVICMDGSIHYIWMCYPDDPDARLEECDE